MENDDDFTFCQVSTPATQDGLGAKNLASEVDRLNVRDGYSNGYQNSNILWKDGLPNNAASKEEETVGSLSFNVIDAASPIKISGSPGLVESSGVGNKVTDLQEPKVPARKPPPRAKVPFEKGYSQMDWLKLTRTHPDLAGLKGQSNRRHISMKEVKQHREKGSMWTVLKGRVYNLSPYMKFHPGGVDMLMKGVGKDCTSLFNKYHAWVNDEFLLEKCLVGILDDIPKEEQDKVAEFSFRGQPAELKHGSVIIAAITSCTNTSNPSVMLGAVLAAKKACELGLEFSFSLQFNGLQQYLNQQGFHIVAYVGTTCIRNSGELGPSVGSAISDNDVVAAAILSGNHNFEGHFHPLTRANYLASPPLLVAYALCQHGMSIVFEWSYGKTLIGEHFECLIHLIKCMYESVNKPPWAMYLQWS